MTHVVLRTGNSYSAITTYSTLREALGSKIRIYRNESDEVTLYYNSEDGETIFDITVALLDYFEHENWEFITLEEV